MLFKILKAILFGKKCVGTVIGYEACKSYRGVDYYRYIVEVKIGGEVKKLLSAENFGKYDGRKPTKHINCEVTVYCSADGEICTLYSPADMLVFLSAVLFIFVIIFLMSL